VTAQQLIERLVVGLADERLPIGDQPQQRSHGDEGVVASRKVGRRARPGQSCGLAQRRARTGLRSTYLTAASRCRSSIMRQWKRSCQSCPFPPSGELIIRVYRRWASPSASLEPSSSEGTMMRCTWLGMRQQASTWVPQRQQQSASKPRYSA
jgi:hypothetical protein